jgi:hypothetical protein
MAPGDEFAFGDIEQYLDESYHGHVIDTTPINPPGIGVDVGYPMIGIDAANDSRRQAMESELTAAHSMDTGGPLRAEYINPPAAGTESVTAWQMRATNRGSTYDERGALVSLPGSDRSALDNSTHNRAKMLIRPIVDYGERPWMNNIAAVTAATGTAPGGAPSPSNYYPEVQILRTTGTGTSYQSPPDPQMGAPATSTEVPGGLEWMTYGA